jgi:murein DD-endopeptidase MepM/ murein hydrolase activator NlpD
MRHFRSVAILIILAGAISPMFSQSPAQGIKNVFWQPNDLQQGSVAFITVDLERVPRRVTGKWIGKDLAFFKSDNPKIWYALAGADLETQPGTYDLTVTAVTVGGRIIHSVKKVDIGAANFRSGAVDVPENFVEPDAASKKQIAADEVLKNRAFSHLIAAPQWSGDFVTPVKAKPTDSFGMTRVFNEELSTTHRGTDFPVNEGAPVVVSNSGTVVLAKELFYEGNCVIVDHGQRLFTIYMHLSKIEVKPGLKLGKGERLGLSGQTGRVTGPHLHMGVRWDGAYLDPTKLLGLTLPKLGPEKQRATTHSRPATAIGGAAKEFTRKHG